MVAVSRPTINNIGGILNDATTTVCRSRIIAAWSIICVPFSDDSSSGVHSVIVAPVLDTKNLKIENAKHVDKIATKQMASPSRVGAAPKLGFESNY